MVPAASRYSQYPRPGISWGGAALGSTSSATSPAYPTIVVPALPPSAPRYPPGDCGDVDV